MYDVVRIRALPLVGKPLTFTLLELFTCECTQLCPLLDFCVLTKCTVVGAALGPTLTVSMPAVGPGVSQVLFSRGLQHRATEVRRMTTATRIPNFSDQTSPGHTV